MAEETEAKHPPERWVGQRVSVRLVNHTTLKGELETARENWGVSIKQSDGTTAFCPWSAVAVIEERKPEDQRRSSLQEDGISIRQGGINIRVGR